MRGFFIFINMSTLTKKQLLLIEDLRDDLEFYKEELNNEVKTHTIYMYIGVAMAVAMGVILVLKPDFVTKLETISESMNTVVGFIGETLPIAFITKSFNSSKVQKRKLKGLRVFEKTISRMEHGIIPNSESDIIAVENDLAVYIST